MPFSGAQNDAFFTNGPQMGLNADTRARLANEGLTVVEDLADFKEEQLLQAYKNMHTSIPGVAAIAEVCDATTNAIITAAVPAVPSILPVLVSARCALRLKVASLAYHFYVDVGRTPTPASMNYTNVLRSFYDEYEAIQKMSEETKPDVPILHKNTTPLRWIESFRDCLYRTFGIRGTPLLYVVRDSAQVEPEVDDPLVVNRAYGRSGSVLDELIIRLNHTDSLFRKDNAMVYSMLEEATRGGVYASTVKPYNRTKDGRAAWNAMVSSHAGTDKWEQLQKDKMKFIMNTKWTGKTYSLEKFCGLHRSAYVQMQEAALHVAFQLPNEHSRVGYLIDNISNSDPDLRAAIASIRIDTAGMRNNFEDAVACILPVDPYVKSKPNASKPNPSISSATL